MNPQPEPYVGNIFGLLFFGLVVYYTIKAYKFGPEKKLDDLFTIGYIENSPVSYTSIVVNESPKNNFESEQIYFDCIDALHALGMKKSEAKKRTREIFSSMTTLPNSIQDFLMIALRKN